jgi:DNA polymerase III delta subunit
MIKSLARLALLIMLGFTLKPYTMLIKPAQATSFLQNLHNNNDVAQILFYGKNYGLSQWYIAQYLKKATSFDKVISFDCDQLDQTMDLLQRETTADLFQSQKTLAIVYNCTDKITSPIKKRLNNGAENSLIVFCADDLTTKSSLRKLFSNPKSQDKAAIACYDDEARDKTYLLQQEFPQLLKLPASSRQYLLSIMPTDRRESINLLRQIKLYCHEQPTSDDLQQFFMGNNEYNIDLYSLAIIQNNGHITDKADGLNMQDRIVLFRRIQNYIRQIIAIKQGHTTMAELRLFYKLKQPFEACLQKNKSIDFYINMLKYFMDKESNIKLYG